MKAFLSSLGPRIETFLALKRAMGRQYRTTEGHLRCFDRYVAAIDAPTETVTRELVHD